VPIVPEQQTSRYFKDISLSFKRHPVTNDIAAITNEDAIKRSVINLVRTRVGERFFNSLLGSRVEDMLFELGTLDIVDPIEEEIRNTIKNFEPRVVLREVNVELIPDSNDMLVSIVYDIVGLPFPAQEITFILQPTRY
jgi:phage baseplate assembly protein W